MEWRTALDPCAYAWVRLTEERRHGLEEVLYPKRFIQNCLVGLVPGANPFLQDPNSFDPGKGPLLNAAAFETKGAFQPAGACPTCTGVYGYTGSGPRITNLRGFGYHNEDFSLVKNTHITERVGFQIRAEAFNVFNFHVFSNTGNFGGSAITTDVSSPSFGLWNGSVSDPRNLQIGAKVIF